MGLFTLVVFLVRDLNRDLHCIGIYGTHKGGFECHEVAVELRTHLGHVLAPFIHLDDGLFDLDSA